MDRRAPQTTAHPPTTTPPQPGAELPGLPPVQGNGLTIDLVATTYVRGGRRGHIVDVLQSHDQFHQWLNAHLNDATSTTAANCSALGTSDPITPPAHDPTALTPGGLLRTLPCGPAPRPNAKALSAVRGARDRLRALLDTLTADDPRPPSLDDIDWINSLAASAHTTPALVPDGSSLTTAWSGTDFWPQFWTCLGRDAQAVVLRHKQALHRCPAPACILFYWDEHHTRRWCSPACGNRVRVARHASRTTS